MSEQFSPTLVPVPDYVKVVSAALDLKAFQIETVLTLTAEGATVPFIARYRKERTGDLDETQIRDVLELKTKEENLHAAKQTAVTGIEEQGKLTPELLKNLLGAKTLKEVEEIYKPYKLKKKTKAILAIEKGFQPVADSIKANALSIPAELLAQYPKEEIVEGAIEIIGTEVSANTELRRELIRLQEYSGTIASKTKSEKMLEKLNAKDREQVPKFGIYAEFSVRVSKIKPYQILALNRGENLGILTVKIEKDDEHLEAVRERYKALLKLRGNFIDELEAGFKSGYSALFESVENEIRSTLKEIGEDDSIRTFQSNLKALLLTKPEYGKTILAVDPGYRAGCKMAVIDALGNPVEFQKMFLHERGNAIAMLKSIFSHHKIEAVIVGNGTACDEACEIVAETFDGETFVVNESGASVYSASPVAAEEFPDLDSLDRGTVSIGRRFIDPLSELVKIPVGSIGVGMYQHDVAEKKLSEKLGYVVEDVVNEVGISVNNASVHVLSHISGIDKREAKKIYNHRPYKSRKDLQKVLSAKAYELAVGFLRVPESAEPLDRTDIHPDQYPVAKRIVEKGVTLENFKSHEVELVALYPDFNKGTLEFVLESLKNAGRDKRTSSTHTKAKSKAGAEVKEGDVVDGVVRNVVAFGAFVDIGMKNDGLVHVSQLADRFVSNPMDVVAVGDRIRVKVLSIDKTTGKIQLSKKGVE